MCDKDESKLVVISLVKESLEILWSVVLYMLVYGACLLPFAFSCRFRQSSSCYRFEDSCIGSSISGNQ